MSNTIDGAVAVLSGKVTRLAAFPSDYVDARNVDVWLPDSYDETKQYAVLYMHDGQMLFDPSTTWNQQAWHVDEHISQLTQRGEIQDCIVVGIWNNGVYRAAEYFPQKALASIPQPTRDIILHRQLLDKPQADDYLRFLVEELKPTIDRTFSTFSDVRRTFIMGSSMGGLISVYALCEYPAIFGGAAALSTHWPLAAFELIDNNNDSDVGATFRAYLAAHFPPANTHKLYFDYGDQTGDAIYEPYQTAVDAILQQRGYTLPFWVTKAFPGESHSEASWNKRLDIPLTFLLSTP